MLFLIFLVGVCSAQYPATQYGVPSYAPGSQAAPAPRPEVVFTSQEQLPQQQFSAPAPQEVPAIQGQFPAAPQGQFSAAPAPQEVPAIQGQFPAAPQGQFSAAPAPQEVPAIQGQFPAAPVPQGQFSAAPAPQGQFPATPSSQDQFAAAPAPQGQFPAAPTSQEQFPTAPASQDQFPAVPTSQEQFPAAPAPQGQFPAAPAPQGQFPAAPAQQGQFPAAPAPQGQFPAAPAPPTNNFNSIQSTDFPQYTQPSQAYQNPFPSSQGSKLLDSTVEAPESPVTVPKNSRVNIQDSRLQYTHGFSDDKSGTQVAEQGSLLSTNAGWEYVIVKKGSYSYISPEGVPVKVNYIADHNGFRIV